MFKTRKRKQLEDESQNFNADYSRAWPDDPPDQDDGDEDDDISFVPTIRTLAYNSLLEDPHSNGSEDLNETNENGDNTPKDDDTLNSASTVSSGESILLANQGPKKVPTQFFCPHADCDISYERLCHLNRHQSSQHREVLPIEGHTMKRPTKALPFACTWPRCKGRFQTKTILIIHAIAIHKAKYWCLWPKCQFKSPNEKETMEHIKQHIKERSSDEVKEGEELNPEKFMELRWTPL